MLKTLFQSLNQPQTVLVVDNNLKPIIIKEKSSLQQESKKLFDFLVWTIDELQQLLLPTIDHNLYLQALENNENLAITKQLVKYSIFDLNNQVDEFNNFKLKYQKYFKIDKINIDYVKDFNLVFLSEPLSLSQVLKTFEINYQVYQISPKNELNTYYEFSLMKDEISHVFLSISKLLDEGVSINNIYLSGVSETNLQIISDMASEYQLPINLPSSISYYDYPYTKTLLKQDMSEIIKTISQESDCAIKQMINNKIISILNQYDYEQKMSAMKILLKELLLTPSPVKVLKNAINIVSLSQCQVLKESFVFVVNANFSYLPTIQKDNEYITDFVKTSINYPTSKDFNKLANEEVLTILKNNSNIYYISRSQADTYNEYEAADCLLTYNKQTINNVKAEGYAKSLYRYQMSLPTQTGSKKTLLTTFSNQFNMTLEEKSKLINYLNGLNIKLSPTDLVKYIKSPFIYYLNKVVKVNYFNTSVPAIIGEFFHELTEVIFRIFYEEKTDKTIRSSTFTQELESMKNDFLIENEDTAVEDIFINFMQEYFSLSRFQSCDDKMNKVIKKAQFFIKKNQEAIIRSLTILINLEEEESSNLIEFEKELSNELVTGRLDLMRSQTFTDNDGSLRKQYNVIDFKSSDRTAFNLETLTEIFESLKNNLPLNPKNLELLQVITYLYLIDDATKVTGGFFTFINKGASKINAISNVELSQFYTKQTPKSTRILTKDDFGLMLAEMNDLILKIWQQIKKGNFNNQVLTSSDWRENLSLTDFSQYHALSLLTIYNSQIEEVEEMEEAEYGHN